MPITLPRTLPAHDILDREGVMVMGVDAAHRQDIRPLRIALVNLMPMKIATETQFARLIGATPLQIDLTLIRMSEHQSRHTSPAHMEAFYRPFRDVRDERFDGLIVTGAPIEHLAFEDVTYWRELRELMDWSRSHVHHSFGVCWGGMAMAWHFHGVRKHMLPAKAFGCYRVGVEAPASPFLRGFSDDCVIPVSRWTEMRRDELEAAGYRVLLGSDDTGPCLVEDPDRRAICIFNHFEYDGDTLKGEYDRDVANGTPVTVPRDYYPGDDPSRAPPNRWRSHGHPPLRQLDQPHLPDHALRAGGHRDRRAPLRRLTWRRGPAGPWSPSSSPRRSSRRCSSPSCPSPSTRRRPSGPARRSRSSSRARRSWASCSARWRGRWWRGRARARRSWPPSR